MDEDEDDEQTSDKENEKDHDEDDAAKNEEDNAEDHEEDAEHADEVDFRPDLAQAHLVGPTPVHCTRGTIEDWLNGMDSDQDHVDTAPTLPTEGDVAASDEVRSGRADDPARNGKHGRDSVSDDEAGSKPAKVAKKSFRGIRARARRTTNPPSVQRTRLDRACKRKSSS